MTYTYQWLRYDGDKLVRRTSSTISFFSLREADVGRYACPLARLPEYQIVILVIAVSDPSGTSQVYSLQLGTGHQFSSGLEVFVGCGNL